MVQPATPFEVEPFGGRREVVVRFRATAGGVWKGELRLMSNDPAHPAVNVSLEAFVDAPVVERDYPARGRMQRSRP